MSESKVANSSTALLQAGYLAIGFLGKGQLEDDENTFYGGQINGIDFATGFANTIVSALGVADREGFEYPSVFEYEVTEEMGAWLRENHLATESKFCAELVVSMEAFFKRDCTSIAEALGVAGSVAMPNSVAGDDTYDANKILITPLSEVDFTKVTIENLIRKTPFVFAYITAALWTNEDELPAGSTIESFSDASMRRAYSECELFIANNVKTLQAAYPVYRLKGGDGHSVDQYAGHDFWLTRHGSAATFLDRGLDELGHILYASAREFGDVDIYKGDDERLHFEGGADVSLLLGKSSAVKKAADEPAINLSSVQMPEAVVAKLLNPVYDCLPRDSNELSMLIHSAVQAAYKAGLDLVGKSASKAASSTLGR